MAAYKCRWSSTSHMDTGIRNVHDIHSIHLEATNAEDWRPPSLRECHGAHSNGDILRQLYTLVHHIPNTIPVQILGMDSSNQSITITPSFLIGSECFLEVSGKPEVLLSQNLSIN